jgi:hypothetical protein
MELTQKERKRLITKGSVPLQMEYWCRTVALDPNPTQQQITTVKELFAITDAYTRNKYWIFEDKLRLTEVSYHTIPRKKANS